MQAPRKRRTALGRLLDKRFEAVWEHRRVSIDGTIPGLIRDAMAGFYNGWRTDGKPYLEFVVPYSELSDGGVQSFTRLSVESSLRIDTLMANMRVEYPQWYIYTDAHGRDRAYNAIRVRRKEDI
jgi:hypothetical protein